jgi:uncharacterized membrane protein
VKLARGLLVLGGFLPWLRALAGRELPTSVKHAIDQASSALCHHLPDRTLVLRGDAMCVCSRCAGLYAGVALAALFSLPGRHVRGRRHVSGSAGAWSRPKAAAWSTPGRHVRGSAAAWSTPGRHVRGSAAAWSTPGGQGGVARYRLALHVGLACMLADIVTQDLGLHAPWHAIRLATGAWVGGALAAWMLGEIGDQRFSATLSRAERSASRKATFAKPA